MKTRLAAALLVVWAGLISARAAQPAHTVGPNVRPNPDYALAAESVLNSAIELTLRTGHSTVARAGRLIALTRLADALSPGDHRVQRLLADIHFAQADPNAEIRALESYLEVRPRDYLVRLRWLAAMQGGHQTADQRGEFLREVAARKDFDDSVRAYAAATLSELRFGQARTDEATQAAEMAVRSDPFGPAPLAAWARTHEPNTPDERLALDLRIIRGVPRDFDAAWRTALRLSELGLHEKAVAFYRHVWAARDAALGATAATPAMTVQYASALLDANRPEDAVEALEPAATVYKSNPDLLSLLIEAYRASGSPAQAERLIADMAQTYKPRRDAGAPKAATSAELGWFYATTQPNPSLAYVYAARALDEDPNNPVYQRIMGAAELIGIEEKAQRGLERLEKLLGKDVYASVLLAGAYRAAGEDEKLRKAVLAAAPLAAGGPAWRNLRTIAARNGIALPAPAGQAKALALLQSLPDDCLHRLAEPDRCLSVVLSSVDGNALVCGDPIEVAVTLKNVSAAELPLGPNGVIRPRLALKAKVEDERGQVLLETGRLPLVIWPAPRALRPAQTVTTQVRLDVCDLAEVVARNPLKKLTLTISGIADPDAEGRSRLAGLTVKPLKITRRSLLGPVSGDTPAGWKQAYQITLGRIVYDYRRGKLPVRVRAARQVGSMLAFAQDIQRSRRPAPGRLAGQVDRMVILAMLRAVLKDPSPAVRAEAVRAITLIQPDEATIGLLAPLIEDPSATVRCRLIETLTVTRSQGRETIIDLMLNDRQEQVRQMARALKGQ